MAVKIGINGFGRIGRLVFRAAVNSPAWSELDIVAVNDLTDAKTLAHLLKFDTVHGRLHATVEARDNTIIVNGKVIKVVSERDPAKLPWKDLGVDLVVESTGRFTDKEKAVGHITAGARKVIISAPAKGEDITIVLGVNEDRYDPAKHHVISNASCTTNCLAPVARVLLDTVGIKRGLMTTVHSYTSDQRLVDTEHSDLRRARAAAQNIIPASTGAAKAIGLVIPELKGKMNGFAMRVPTADVSVVDLVIDAEKPTTAEEVNAAYAHAAGSGRLAPYLEYSNEPLVSGDFTTCPKSAIVDGLSTMVCDGTMVKVVAWYDNEWGYSNRVVDLARLVAGRM